MNAHKAKERINDKRENCKHKKEGKIGVTEAKRRKKTKKKR